MTFTAQSVSPAQDRVVALLRLDTTSAESIEKLVDAYPELNVLRGKKVAGTVEAGGGSGNFEFDRTITSLACLADILNSNYEKFITPQAADAKLSQATFNELVNLINPLIKSHGKLDNEAVDALATYVVMSDLGKAQEVRDAVHSVTGSADFDHDLLFKQLMQNVDCPAFEKFTRSYERLSVPWRENIKNALFNGLNLGHILQGETAAGAVQPLSKLSSDAALLEIAENITDIAGALGHKQEGKNGSLLLDEGKTKDIVIAANLLMTMIPSDLSAIPESPPRVFDAFTEYKAAQFGFVGIGETLPPVEGAAEPKLTERAVTKCALLGRWLEKGYDPKDVLEAWKSLSEDDRATLVDEMNRSGIGADSALVPTYMPAIIDNLMKGKEDARVAALATGLALVARIYRDVRTELDDAIEGMIRVDGYAIAGVLKDSPERAGDALTVITPTPPANSFGLNL